MSCLGARRESVASVEVAHGRGGRVLGEAVQVGVRARVGEDHCVSLRDLATTLPFEGSRHHGRTARGIAMTDELVNEGDQVIGEADCDLCAHTKTVPRWDAPEARQSRTSVAVLHTDLAAVLTGPASTRDYDSNCGQTTSGTLHLQVTGQSGLPLSGVSVVVLNVTVTEPMGAGFVSVYGDGTVRSSASDLNFVAAQTVPNLVIAPVGANGKVALYKGSAGTIQLIADVSGWFTNTNDVPGLVTNVRAIPNSTLIALSWTNPTVASFTGVMIRRALGSTPPASTTAGTLVTDAATPAMSFTDTALLSGTLCTYALFARNGTPGYATAATVTSNTTAAGSGNVSGTVTDAGGTHQAW